MNLNRFEQPEVRLVVARFTQAIGGEGGGAARGADRLATEAGFDFRIVDGKVVLTKYREGQEESLLEFINECLTAWKQYRVAVAN